MGNQGQISQKVCPLLFTDYAKGDKIKAGLKLILCNHAKELANDIAWWYNGDVESAELWVFCEINNIVAIVASVKMEIEFLEHIIDNVNKMMDEAKAKSEELGVEYIEGYTCVAGVSVPVQKPYPEVKNKYDL